MEITTQKVDDGIEVRPKGRLDGYWADHLSRALEEVMRQGNDCIRINLSEVSYISSLGIGVLVKFYKKVQAINGSFVIADPSENVRRVIGMVNLGDLLTSMPPPARERGAANIPVRKIEGPSAVFEVYELMQGASLQCRIAGDSTLLKTCQFTEANCQTLLLAPTSFAFGLGAFGHSFNECRGHFGEFLAVAGAAAYQPTDGSNIPDFLVAQGAAVPELQVLYGAICDGAFGALVRFETKPEAGAVKLSELANAALDVSGSDVAGIVCIAESAGLVGASLRRPPVNGDAKGDLFTHPEVRNWLSFTTERAHTRALAVLVGLASRTANGDLRTILRPLSEAEGTAGHFHAAAFSYRPLQRGLVDLDKTIRDLFEHEKLLGILHLIGDDREAVGVSESEFVRGACWVAPITGVGRQGS